MKKASTSLSIQPPADLDASEDKWGPTFKGHTLNQLQDIWRQAAKKIVAPDFSSIAPIRSIALVGAVRDETSQKLNLRDELACTAIVKNILPQIGLDKDFSLTLYNLNEGNDVFVSTKHHDLVIMCNLRQLEPELIQYYKQVQKTGTLESTLQQVRQPLPYEVYSQDTKRLLVDALQPSDILTGERYRGISQAHQYYVTVSPEAFAANAYQNLAKKLQARFIATWGFQQFVDETHFTANARYDQSKPEGERIVTPDHFIATQDFYCGEEIISPYQSKAGKVMPRPPQVGFAVRGDVLEQLVMAHGEIASRNPLLQEGVATFKKMDVLAGWHQRLGRKPIASAWQVEVRSLTNMQNRAMRPLGPVGKLERFIRTSLNSHIQAIP